MTPAPCCGDKGSSRPSKISSYTTRGWTCARPSVKSSARIVCSRPIAALPAGPRNGRWATRGSTRCAVFKTPTSAKTPEGASTRNDDDEEADFMDSGEDGAFAQIDALLALTASTVARPARRDETGLV